MYGWIRIVLLVLSLVATGYSFAASEQRDFDPELLLREASSLLQQGAVLECAEIYEQLHTLSSDPEIRAQALVRQAGLAALYLSAPETALTLYDRAITEAPPGEYQATALYNAAMLRYEMGRLAEAADDFSAYLSLYPDGPRRQSASYMLERSRRDIGERAKSPDGKPRSLTHMVKEPVVRVLLEKAQSVSFDAPNGAHLLFSDGGYETLPGRTLSFTYRDGRVFMNDRDVGREAVLLPEGGGFIWSGQRYPGEAAVVVEDGGLALVNRLPLETYLWGVVPAEMPASFAPQALSAQAVAARSYAAALLQGRGDRQWDLLASKLSQVYKGVRAGDPRIREAVESTAGRMLMHEGRPVLSYFHSHSGGVLEDDAAVWNGDLPFYAVQQDPASPRARKMEWSLKTDWGELSRALRSQGIKAGRIRGLEVLSRTQSGRLGDVRVLGDSGSVTVSGTLLRRALGTGRMRSTLCEVVSGPDAAIFKGRGFGHGVGMSQWGAQGMALAGSDYRAILAHYYPGVPVERVY